jgi:hypothetical protein
MSDSMMPPPGSSDSSSSEQRIYIEVSDRYQTSTFTKVLSVVLAILTAGYMLPWAIAAVRNLRTHVSVGLVDLLLGWTLVGWIVALVMSLRKLRPDEG